MKKWIKSPKKYNANIYLNNHKQLLFFFTSSYDDYALNLIPGLFYLLGSSLILL